MLLSLSMVVRINRTETYIASLNIARCHSPWGALRSRKAYRCHTGSSLCHFYGERSCQWKAPSLWRRVRWGVYEAWCEKCHREFGLCPLDWQLPSKLARQILHWTARGFRLMHHQSDFNTWVDKCYWILLAIFIFCRGEFTEEVSTAVTIDFQRFYVMVSEKCHHYQRSRNLTCRRSVTRNMMSRWNMWVLQSRCLNRAPDQLLYQVLQKLANVIESQPLSVTATDMPCTPFNGLKASESQDIRHKWLWQVN